MLILLIILVAFPAIIWTLRLRPHLLPHELKILPKMMNILLIIICIWIIFEFSFVQVTIASYITEGTVTSNLVTTVRNAYHPPVSDTIYSFTAANPGRQWVLKAVGYGLMGLMLASVLLSFSGGRRIRHGRR